MAILARAQAGDLQSLDRSPAGTARTGARLLRLLAAAISGRRPSGMPVHEQLGEGWQLPDAAARDAIRSALVVSADHELNASTFTVRCVASTDATPYAAVIAGLTALQGPRHGGMTGQVEAMLAEASDSADAGTVIAARLQRGDRLPGFGHPLYPDGDPRAALLLPRVSQLAEAGNRPGVLTTLAEAAWNLTGQLPNIDFALAGLAWCLGLPKGAAFSLFALGRTVGWIGHAREQYALDRLIRPRAAYVGPRPEPIGEVPV
jgi:citrate synthase